MINPSLLFDGGMEYALTFLLVSAIVYAVFGFVRKKDTDKGGFFLDEKTSGIVSVIIGLFAAIDPTVTGMIQNYMPLFIGLLALFFLVMLGKKLMGDSETDNSTLAVVLLALIVIVSAIGTDTFERYIGFQAENVMWGVGILVLGALLWKAAANKTTG
ncbi:MAG: hypothetical protein KAT91_02510 [Candidatus Aenigmarchaeota archaeon]|nr:hypothetical protein [Candidatus Aenigmarchaeota archaeon]